jgi:hypothetical protein
MYSTGARQGCLRRDGRFNTQHRSVTLNNGINIIIPLVPGVPYTIDSKDLQDPVAATYSGPDHAHNNEPIFLLK